MRTTTLDGPRNPQTGSKRRGARVGFRWLKSLRQASEAAKTSDATAIWIIDDSRLADQVAHEAAMTNLIGKSGAVVLLIDPRPPLLPVLEKRFKRVAFPSRALPRAEFDWVLKAPDRNDRIIGGTVDKPSETITVWRGDLKPLVIPFNTFKATANGVRPNFDVFSVTDYGSTLKLGEYEAATDAVLYEHDPEFRRRLKHRRFAEEDSLGASIRRLRMQRQLTRQDFPTIDPKTLARIENGQVRKPHPDTLKVIARQLGVRPEELETF